MTGWEIFPFEPDGLRVVPLDPPVLPEPDRHGEGGSPCGACGAYAGVIWENANWRLSAPPEPSGAPLVLLLQPKDHHDLGDLPDDLAGELGRLIVHVARAIEALPHIARAHVSKWGDGGAHLHVFFFARPEGFSQLRGTCMAIWDDLLPPTPRDLRDQDAAAVAQALTSSYGGSVSGADPEPHPTR
jgi:diadenosine tetraphosphate (Ap4A) HIT family hydrolase